MTRIPGEHAPNIKNRSSKHLIPLTKHRAVERTMSYEALTRYNTKQVIAERKRRERINTSLHYDPKKKSFK